MRSMVHPILAGVLVVATVSCAGEREQRPAEDGAVEAARERAEESAQALGRELMQRLLAELETAGPVEAVRVCSEVAREIAADHSVDGITVRRVSLKVRNPADAPDDFERAALVELGDLHEQGRLPDDMTKVVATDEGRRLRYLRPIVIVKPCLTCHGSAESIDPEVARMIDERYPEDQAKDYADGDLRGAISVSVPLD